MDCEHAHGSSSSVSRYAVEKQKLSVIFLGGWFLLTVVGGPDGEPILFGTPRAWCYCYHWINELVLWKYRKMGVTPWRQTAAPTQMPLCTTRADQCLLLGDSSFGLAWLLCLGIRMLFLAGVPVYFTLRSAVAFVTGCGMVPVVLLVDYAHDEGAEFTGFGTDGRFFWSLLGKPHSVCACLDVVGSLCIASCDRRCLHHSSSVDRTGELHLARLRCWRVDYVQR